MKQFDYIIIGSGIAGLTFALKIAPHGPVAIITKKNLAEANTQYAQGGIAAVTKPTDSFDLHVADTLRAGGGLCKEEIVRTVVEEGPARVQELVDFGMEFTREETISADGERFYSLGKEGGHSKRRVLHAKDATGREVMRALLAAVERTPNVSVFEDHIAIDLITTHKLGRKGGDRCVGAYVLDRNTGAVETFSAPHTLLATGGCGKVYLYTTNPDIATGDGVAMAYRAGVPVSNMEFTQFHPTCLYHPKAKSFLVSEALRGEGAVLKDLDGREFMDVAHPMASLAPRDIVARAIDSEMKRTGADHMLLDITHKPAPFIIDRFPNIFLAGGAPQMDLWDPKPYLNANGGKVIGNRKLLASPFKFPKYGKSGLQMAEIWPNLGRHADDIAIVRSTYTDAPAHGPATYMQNTGEMQDIRPAVGSWVLYGLGTENQRLPGFITMRPGGMPDARNYTNSFLPAACQGTFVNSNNTKIGTMSAAPREAFDVGREKPETIARYGQNAQGRQMLMARRLLERGVRFVQVWQGGWDLKGGIAQRAKRLANELDPAIGALMDDLKDRGLFKDTLIYIISEFGRGATEHRAGGRGHNARAMSTVLAGGGIKGGIAYGKTDELGQKVVENPVHVKDIHATVLHLLGLNHEKLTFRIGGRDFRLTQPTRTLPQGGQVVKGILA